MFKTMTRKVVFSAIMLGALVTIAVPQATTMLSAVDRGILTAIKNAVELFSFTNGKVGTVLYDINGNAVGWSSPATGIVSTTPSSPVAVSTSTSVYTGSDATVREVIIRNPSTSTANVACLFAAAAATVANATYEAAPGQSIRTGKDGYTGEIRCIAVSGTQTVSVTKIN